MLWGHTGCDTWEMTRVKASHVFDVKEQGPGTQGDVHSPSLSLFPCTARGEGGGGSRRLRSEAELGKKGGKGEGVFSFLFVSHYPTVFLNGNQLN